ncbi:hypothetical protein U6G28_07915 [Actinomycetaceae bacterium MB13-C1-2]|nr:hypothetical protein U6G28_07915 [Actinomycetaceae bacterium MB13-C1-2]
MNSNSAARVAPSYAPRYTSAASRPVRRSSLSEQESGHPHIQVVTRNETASPGRAWPIVLLALLILTVAIALPLVVNTHMAQTSYAIRDLRVELAEVNTQSTVLESRLLELNAAPALQERAETLGFVRAAAPGAVSLVDGTVTGGEPAK